MKVVAKVVAVLALTTLCAGPALAVEGGNPKKGKYLFKKNCKACHTAGAAGGKVTPLSKTMSQWDRFFKQAKHDPAAWEGLNEDQLKDINQFLFDHAVDSDQPQTCG